MAKTVYICILTGLSGCDRPISKWGPLSFPSPISDGRDSGSSPEPEPPKSSVTWIASPNIDDGFGAAVAFGNDQVWIGAPHGESGTVYKWNGTELSVVLSQPGRLGSHLAWTNTGLWMSAPLFDHGSGAIFLEDGRMVGSEYPSTGITLTSSGGGAYGWADGWTDATGATNDAIGRPSSVHITQGGMVGLGMAQGSHYFQTNGMSQARARAGDEAGFALSSGDVDNDQTEEWIIGAPGTNEVVALHSTTNEILRRWRGVGRFGHAIAVCSEPNGDTHLLIGAPLSADGGTVWVFTNFSAEPTATWTGPSVDAELGTSIACTRDGFLAGAPGNAHTNGVVLFAQGFRPISTGSGVPTPAAADFSEDGTGVSIQ